VKARLGALWREHRLLALAFSLALVVTIFFALRTVVFVIYWSDPAHRNQPLEGWMTPRYIAYSYDLTDEQMTAVMGDVPELGRRPTLERIADARGLTMAQLIKELNANIQSSRGAGE